MTAQSTVICAWCGTKLADAPGVDPAAPVWYGMCNDCVAKYGGGMFPTQNLYALDAAAYDALPMGVLQLAPDATVLSYNAAEEGLSGFKRENVLGRNFFTDIAPCTRVQSFEGVFRDLVARGETARHAFDFVVRFKDGERFVHIAMTYDAPERRALILVQAAAAEA